MSSPEARMAWFALAQGLSLFAVSFLIQLGWWRRQRVRKQMLGLGLIYFFLPALFSLAWGWIQHGGIELLWGFGFHACLAAAYVATFPAIQAQSPSLSLLLWIHRRAPRGCTPAEVVANFSSSAALAQDRWRDLAADGLMGARGEIRFAGRALGAFFAAYRRWMRISGENG